MTRVALALAIAAVVALVAWLVERRRGRRTRPAVSEAHHVPTHLDRDDFARADAPWLVIVFTSATCSSCADVWDRARHLEADVVAVQEVEIGAEPAIHRRYGIDAVPTTVVADAAGVVRGSFLGPVSATHLWAAMAEVRAPGSVPTGCEGTHGTAADDDVGGR